MVRTTMSSDNSEPEESESLIKAKEKVIIQQSLIDSSARTLQRLKESTSRLLIGASSTSINGMTHSSYGETQSAIDDDIKLQENKLMKGFSNQLIEKHRYLKALDQFDCSSEEFLLKVKHQFDELINLEQFLNIISLQPSAVKALVDEENLTLDTLFSMSTAELEQLMSKYSIAVADVKKLLSSLDLLSTYYKMWERGEKPSVTAPSRLGSTTSSRLNSLSNLSFFDHDSRTDSISSSTSAGTSPLPITFPSSTPIPLTPLSSQSLLSPSSPFTTALSSSTPLNNSIFTPSQMIPVLTPPPTSTTFSGSRTQPSHGLIRSHSSSSNVLLGETDSTPSRSLARTHHSVSCLSSNRTSQTTSPLPPAPSGNVGKGQTTGGGSERKRKLPLTHKRSLSNPLNNIILMKQDEELAPPLPPTSNHVPTTNGYNESSLAHHSYRSPSPPSRSGSQPSIPSNHVGGGSPQPTRTRHPQMKRVAASSPGFSQSISNDQLISSSVNNSNMSGSESVLCHQNINWQSPTEGIAPRCNSMAGMSHPNYSQANHQSSGLKHMDLTSTSMVDLPVGPYGGSSEHLDQIEECNLPNSAGKSRSVPRLLMTISTDNDRMPGIPSTSTPTSPHTPEVYTPTSTGSMRHTIMHRFTTKTFMTPHLCDYCKRTVMIGVRCKDCKYKCHKSCSAKAPPSCGLPQELMNFFRKHVSLASSMERLADQRVEPKVQSPSEPNAPRPLMERSNTYDLDLRDPEFIIQNLSSEPTNTHYSPILDGTRRTRAETVNGVIRHELSSQSSSTSLLEVPHTRMPGMYRSTSSTPSPSTSPPTSPSLTPSSPRSPNEYIIPGYSHYRYSPRREGRVFPESGDEFYESESQYSTDYSSTDDISDQSRMTGETPRGLRPGPQVIEAAKSLPNLLRISPTEKDVEKSCSEFLEKTVDGKEKDGTVHKTATRRVSMECYGLHSSVKRKESLQRKLSTADSKASTLVASCPTEEDDCDEYDSDSYIGSQEIEEMERDYKPTRPLQHRNSIVDEWSIPYDQIQLCECIGRGRMSQVYKGNWHGKVAIKRFFMPNATRQQIVKFKEEVSVLKKTRHENLALFMGASLVPPNLAIVTIYCKGPNLYKCIHVWSEPFPFEKIINVAKEIAQAMGYLHARSIVHKNLNTKNIFLEKDIDKVVITDTGLSSLSDNFWIDKHQLVIRRNKLYYLAPELIKKLAYYPPNMDNWQGSFPHSEETDVYAFGTVLYELMIRKFPFFCDQYGFSIPPAVLIHLIVSGRRPEMQSKDVPKKMQDLIYSCWKMNPENRLPFKTIHEALIKMSKIKKTLITRSPSFPITLSKSTEGLNFLNS